MLIQNLFNLVENFPFFGRLFKKKLFKFLFFEGEMNVKV